MKPFLMAIDLDGVLYPYHEVFRDWAVDKGMLPKGTTVKEAFKFLRNKNARFIENIMRIPEIYGRRLPNPDIIASVWRIYEEYPVEIIYLTSRPKEVEFTTKQWLKDFPAPEAVFFTNNKQRFCEENDVNILLDDRLENLVNHRNTIAVCVQSFSHPDVTEPRFRNPFDGFYFGYRHLV